MTKSGAAAEGAGAVVEGGAGEGAPTVRGDDEVALGVGVGVVDDSSTLLHRLDLGFPVPPVDDALDASAAPAAAVDDDGVVPNEAEELLRPLESGGVGCLETC